MNKDDSNEKIKLELNINQNEKIFKKFRNDLTKLLNQQKMYNFVIKAGIEQHEFKLHRTILSARSEFFAYICGDEKTKSVSFPHINSRIMENILKYIYTNKIECKRSDLLDFWIFSREFKLKLLEKVLEQEVFNNINSSTAFLYISTSVTMKSQLVENECINFIAENFGLLDKKGNLGQLSQETVLKIARKVVDYQKSVDFELVQMIQNWAKEKLEMDSIIANQKEKRKQTRKIAYSVFSQIDYTLIKKDDFKKIKALLFFPQEIAQKLENQIANQQVTTKTSEIEKEINEQREFKRKKEEKQREIQKRKESIKKDREALETEKEKLEKMKESYRKSQKRLLYEQMMMRKIESTEIGSKIIGSKIIGLKIPDFKISEIEENPEKKLPKKKSTFSLSAILRDYYYWIQLFEWIRPFHIQEQPKIAFSTSLDGWSSQAFHRKIDNKGATCVVVETVEGFIFGGFTQVGFVSDPSCWCFRSCDSNSGWIKDPNSFLFSLENPDGSSPQKFPIQKDKDCFAVCFNPQFGPVFGNFRDLGFFSDLRQGFSELGENFQSPNLQNQQDCLDFFAGPSKNWRIKSIEIFLI
ncbi:pep-cterm sorting domain-containing protein [Anaeramoeba ignava]|uniref:Pep-cterm sorting domain-containing protein n=1 Tax=Anaeramoeba ignava TaxID=1746090 RepID=A0A9Q0LBG2_ANAIG|nr:pep-cterm sorting domain-containing protein [Anaeramoeba ignava]